jgi:ribosomal protein S12 methylthiotransferase
MVSLGCPKNQVDAEQMLGVLAGSGFTVTPEQAEADVIVVNTCGFIESAKEESIEAILDAAKMKKQGKCRALIVAGCLAQRYKGELLKELPEADAIIGTAEIGRIGARARVRPAAPQHDPRALSLPQDRRRVQQPLLLLRDSGHSRELQEQALRLHP